MKSAFLFLIGMMVPFSEFLAQNSQKNEFIYMLSLDSKFHDEKNWTENDQKIVGEHFNYLKKAKADGKLILAGRTDESNEKTFGIVIFYATDSVSARSFMNSDPAVKAGIMKASIHPYKVALIKD